MKSCGYGYTIIGWVDDTAKDFYEKEANVWYIPDSEPNKTLYMRRIRTSIEFDDSDWNKDHARMKNAEE